MGYTWTDGELITATKLNNTGGGGNATVRLSATAYTTVTQTYGYIVYAIYDENNSRWVVAEDANAYWTELLGFGNGIPRIIPLYLTALPNDENVGLFFVVNGNPTVSVTGDITATTLYFSWGSQLAYTTYRITGDGSISLDNG